MNRILSCVVRSLSLSLLLVLLPPGACAARGDGTSAKAARIDALVSRYEKYGYLNGAVLVAERGEIIYERGVGYANMDSHRPNTPRTKFGIASLTKRFTAVLVLQGVADGKIRLEARIIEYLPWYRKDTGERMTVEQPLRHTSGLPPDFDSPEFSDSEAASQHYEPQAFAEKFCQENLQSEPGTKWQYSNCGYDLLGLILEEVTGKSFTKGRNFRLCASCRAKVRAGALRRSRPYFFGGGDVFHCGRFVSVEPSTLRWRLAAQRDSRSDF